MAMPVPTTETDEAGVCVSSDAAAATTVPAKAKRLNCKVVVVSVGTGMLLVIVLVLALVFTLMPNQTSQTLGAAECESTHASCDNDNTCVHPARLCDGIPDCYDHWDENDC